jgi:peroxiredoxin
MVLVPARSERTVTLKMGDRVSDFTFVQRDGKALTLATFAGRPLLLIFLRHLG